MSPPYLVHNSNSTIISILRIQTNQHPLRRTSHCQFDVYNLLSHEIGSTPLFSDCAILYRNLRVIFSLVLRSVHRWFAPHPMLYFMIKDDIAPKTVGYLHIFRIVLRQSMLICQLPVSFLRQSFHPSSPLV